MDELVHQLEQLTGAIFNKLDSLTFEEISDFVEQREKIVVKLQALQSTSAELNKYKDRIAVILQQDSTIFVRMKALKHDAAQAINKISSGRIQKSAYNTPYSMDGVYFDKKK